MNIMDEKSPTFWKRPWQGPVRILAWAALLAGGLFVVISCISLVTDKTTRRSELMLVALIISVAVAGLLVAGVMFVRWISCWRSFRRLLFGIACFLTLIVLVYAEENWRGKHAWENYRREWEAKGEKFSIRALVPAEVPEEKNFALTPLLKPLLDMTYGPAGKFWRDTNGLARLQRMSANLPGRRGSSDSLVLGNLEKGTFADLAACAQFYRGNTNYPQAEATATPAEVILAALGKFDPELKELQEAAVTRPSARFPIDYDYEPSWGILLPHLAPVKGLTQLLDARATAELEAGRAAEAFQDLKLGLRFSESIREEPILIDHLVRIATLGIDLQIVREGLVRRAWNEAQLAELETSLSSVDLLAEYKQAMRGERAWRSCPSRRSFRSAPSAISR